MRPSDLRAASRVSGRPHRSQVPLLLRAAQLMQRRPLGPSRGSSTLDLPQSVQAGRTTAVCPAVCKTLARRTTTGGQWASPEVRALG
jgi:hypothetical protein